MANQEMERAFRFAGYQVDHAWGEGGHEGKQANEVFPAAIKFLWQGWPERVKAGEGSPQMKDVLLPGEGWQLVGEGYGFTEGPAVNAKGEVFFNDIPASKTYRIGADGKPALFVENGDKGNGQRFGADGRLYQTGLTKLVAFDEHHHPRRPARQRPGGAARRRRLHHRAGLGRHQAEQGVVRLSQGREAGGR
jgi:hypothetical protein